MLGLEGGCTGFLGFTVTLQESLWVGSVTEVTVMVAVPEEVTSFAVTRPVF
jgi:hypothetical protein